ncbi:MAG: ribosome silencing factor [Methylibium sp.]|uniref:ribosome silencing factor n=1 Tax=Methylibium sp. TaxID=2067992 RepID=UPI00183346CC|nr:ribosome silencing factor [Methylibium sp.]MBA3598508.1 ribosome silencing factor [Methylibium sp.]
MDIRKLQRAIVDGLEDVKAHDIVVFNTEHLSALFERVIIASGTSNRQTKALAASVRDAVKVGGFPVLRTEGEENGEWIIVDCGAAVAHIMQPDIRRYYHLEELWGGKSVKMKLGEATRGLVKAAEPEEDEPAPRSGKRAGNGEAPTVRTSQRGASRPTAAKKSVAKKPAARKPAAKTAAKTTAKPGGRTSAPARPAGRSSASAPGRGGRAAAGSGKGGVAPVANAPATAPAARKSAGGRPAAKAGAKKTVRRT